MKKTHDLDNNARAGLIRLVVLIGVFTLTCMTFAQSGGPYEVTWTTIDGGGQTSVGGPYTAAGTIGQPDAGAMTGGIFQVLGGFWPSALVDTDGDGLADGQDNCPGTYNPNQEDTEPANGMIAYWKFDENSGSTVAADSIGGNDGTVHEAQWTTGRVGGALEFDGVNDYVQTAISGSLNLNGQDVSISVWAKFNQFTDWYESIYAYGESGGWYTLYVSDANNLHMRIGGNYLNGNSELHENQWYHLVGVYDGAAQTITLYVNAAEDGSKGSVSWGNSIADTYAVIGASRSLATEHINAIIDEVAVYNRVLLSAEILQHYHNGLLDHGYGGDGVGDACDNCPGMFNPAQADRNSDGWGDLCECTAANLDGKGTVDLIDLSMVLSGWFDSGPGLAGDINSDDIVDWRDLEILAYYWLSGCRF